MYKGLGSVLRHRSVNSIIEEIKEVVENHQIKTVWFMDDTFVLKPPGWIEQFSRRYKNEVGLPFYVQLRANVVKEEDLVLLKEAGLFSVWLGVECADEEVANKILKRNLENTQIEKAAKIVKDLDLPFGTENLIGLPVPLPYETDKRTLDFNIALQPTFAWASILYPYPKTDICDYSIEHGYYKDEGDCLETNKRDSMLKYSSKLEKRRVVNLHKLFAMIVRFPCLRPYCDILCSLPLTPLYQAIFFFSYGYFFKRKLQPVKINLRSMKAYWGLFFKMLFKK